VSSVTLLFVSTLSILLTAHDSACTWQDATSRGAIAGQEQVSQGLAAAQGRIKVLEANLAEAHATVRSTWSLSTHQQILS
jgi:hypothetical protein